MRYPEPGRVKTRLAKDIGETAACDIYMTMVERILLETAPANGDYERVMFYSSTVTERQVKDWVPGERLIAQRGTDIGRIMENAFCDMFAGGAEKAMVAGVDVPGLNRTIVSRAFIELEHADIVIGPATDGGYYLVGMKCLLRDIFRDMPWGTDKVLEETLRVIAGLRLSVRTVRPLTDVDTLGDLLHVKGLYPSHFKRM